MFTGTFAFFSGQITNFVPRIPSERICEQGHVTTRTERQCLQAK